MISNNEFFGFCMDQYEREFLLLNPEGIFTAGFVKNLNELFMKSDRQRTELTQRDTFNYVNITTKGCEGWLNLFFDDHVIALVDNVCLADKIRQEIPERNTRRIAANGKDKD